MALNLKDCPPDMNELAWTRMARVAYATRINSQLNRLMASLIRNFETARGITTPEERRTDELENLNFLTDIASRHLEALILIFDRINDQIEGVFDDEGITIDITNGRAK